MCITQLHLSFFRNYKHLFLTTLPNPVILAGKNGAGKTNLLEAISLFSPGRGIRKASFSNISCHTDFLWESSITLKNGVSLGSRYLNDKRQIKAGGELIKNQKHLQRFLNLLWLTPEHDHLFMCGSSIRRKFLDHLVYIDQPEHLTNLQQYDHFVKERLTLLRTNFNDGAWLSILEQKIVHYGLQISERRQEMLDTIEQTPLNLFPLFGTYIDDFFNNEDQYINALQHHRKKDAIKGITHVGPHRQNWYVTKNHRPANQCSMGEQKILLLSFVFSFIHSQKFSAPFILLLDDLASHLDFHHRTLLFGEVEFLYTHQQVQTWITGTDASLFDIPSAQVFTVDSGCIK